MIKSYAHTRINDVKYGATCVVKKKKKKITAVAATQTFIVYTAVSVWLWLDNLSTSISGIVNSSCKLSA